MPCTRDALGKHIERAVYQAAIWQKALDPIIGYPEITNHGWLIDDERNVSIDWMDFPPAPDGILENTECSCKKGCATNRCSCFKASLARTGLCKCNDCSNGKNDCYESSESESSRSESEGDSDVD